MKGHRKPKKIFRKEMAEKKPFLSKEAIGALVIVLIMALSAIAFVWEGGGSKEEYNGVSFELLENNMWTAKINSQKMLFYYHPMELEYLNVSSEASERLKSTKMVYATSDPEDRNKDRISALEFDLSEALQGKETFIVNAFTSENEYNKTIITCDNATQFVPVIYFVTGNETSIRLEGDCVIAEADTGADFARIRDRLIYAFFDVIPG